MRDRIPQLDATADEGLARMVAGYARKWTTKKDPQAYDGVRLRWKSRQHDGINSEKAVFEVGSIHTVQGYDLTYAGVIIGPDPTEGYRHSLC